MVVESLNLLAGRFLILIRCAGYGQDISTTQGNFHPQWETQLGQRKACVAPVSRADHTYELPEGNRKSIHMAVVSLYPLNVYEFMVV